VIFVFLRFDNTLVMHYVATDNFCKVKTVYSISIHFSKVWIPFYSGHLIYVTNHLRMFQHIVATNSSDVP
jgi:hypothetical protein